jgi:hypothetical protein
MLFCKTGGIFGSVDPVIPLSIMCECFHAGAVRAVLNFYVTAGTFSTTQQCSDDFGRVMILSQPIL